MYIAVPNTTPCSFLLPSMNFLIMCSFPSFCSLILSLLGVSNHSPCSVSMNAPDLQLVCTLTLVLEDPSQTFLAIHVSFYVRHKHRNEVGMTAVAL